MRLPLILLLLTACQNLFSEVITGAPGRISDTSAILLRPGEPNHSYVVQRGFLPEHWLSCYLRLPQPSAVPLPQDTVWKMASLSFTQSNRADFPGSYLEIHARQVQGKWRLAALIRPSADPNRHRRFELTAPEDSLFLLEVHCGFNGDSLQSGCYLNGELQFTTCDRFYNFREYTFWIFVPPPASWAPFEARLDGLTLTSIRSHGMPFRPVPGLVSAGPFTTVFSNQPYRSSRQNDDIAGVEWRLRSPGPDSPLIFQDRIDDPGFFENYHVPYMLDSGIVLWDMRYQDNFGNWSEWSRAGTFAQNQPPPVFLQISDIRILNQDGGRVEKQLVPGVWYRMSITLSTHGRPWSDLGYMIVQLHRPGYVYGHPGNKGGPYLPDSNLVINLSFNTDDNVPWVFEKAIPGSQKSDPLPKGALGLFTDAASIRFDTLAGTIAVNFRFPDSASAGDWSLTAWLVENSFARIATRSSIYRDRFRVNNPGQRTSRLRVTALVFLAGIIATGLLLLFKRKKPGMAPAGLSEDRLKRDWETLLQHVQGRLEDSSINVNDIRLKLRLSKDYFYQLLRWKGVDSFPQFITDMRIEAAKKLLKETRLSISEVAYKTGFSDLSYFSNTFRKKTGISPKDYRNA